MTGKNISLKNYISKIILTLSMSSVLFLVSADVLARPALSKKQSKSSTVKSSEKKEAEVSDVKEDESKETRIVKKIEVSGNKKLESEAVVSRLKTKVGDKYSSERIREDVVSLFKSGYFYDIKVDRKILGDEVTLSYIVVEKPSIAEIAVEGVSELKSDEVQEAAGLKAYEILNNAKIKEGTDKIQKLYEDKGFFLVKVESRIEDVVKDETVKVVYKITENDKVKVAKVTFLGNEKLKDGFLKGRMMTNEGGYFSFMSGSGAYKQDAFDRDVSMLRFIYFNEGYVQVKIDRPQVYVTPDKKSIYITIRIDEGEQYEVGDIDFAGDLLFSREELANSINLNKQKIFSYETLQKDLGELQAKYGDLGYAFANVIPRHRVNEKERKVDVTYEFDKGNKVYFGQINVIGNSKTRDKVVRRELKVFEGELYNETRKRQSQEGIQRLGFFEDVTFKTSTPPEKPDVLNIDIVVKERNTGSIQLGAGYGSATGGSLQGKIEQSNFFGKGQKLGAGLNISSTLSTYYLNFTEPHYNDTDWSLGFDLYQSQANRYDYLENIKGGALRVGHPISEFMSLTLRYRYDQTQLDAADKVPGWATPVIYYNITDTTLFPLSTANGDTSSITAMLEWDERNDRFSPSKGIYSSASIEYAGLGGSLNYSKGNTTFRYFKKVVWDLVWRNNISYSFLNSNNGQEPPFNQRFLLGGPYSLRGYRFGQVGKTKYSATYAALLPNLYQGITAADIALRSNRPIGGVQQAIYQMEFEFPLVAEAGIKGVAFYDVGAADDIINSSNIYSDVGFGFRWFSPIGPLRFEWGFPLVNCVQSPEAVQFQFSIGAPF